MLIPLGYKGILFTIRLISVIWSVWLMCTFRASCCRVRLSWAQVPVFTGSSVRDRKKKRWEGIRGGGGNCLHWQVQGSTSSPTKVGSRWRVVMILWNLECPIGLSQKRICVHFSEGNLPKINSGATKCFGFSGSNVAQIGPGGCSTKRFYLQLILATYGWSYGYQP